MRHNLGSLRELTRKLRGRKSAPQEGEQELRPEGVPPTTTPVKYALGEEILSGRLVIKANVSGALTDVPVSVSQDFSGKRYLDIPHSLNVSDDGFTYIDESSSKNPFTQKGEVSYENRTTREADVVQIKSVPTSAVMFEGGSGKTKGYTMLRVKYEDGKAHRYKVASAKGVQVTGRQTPVEDIVPRAENTRAKVRGAGAKEIGARK